MKKMPYAKPVTDIEVQAYTETHLMSGSGFEPFKPAGDFKEGVPVSGSAINNPSFIKGGSNGIVLWDEEETDY